MFLASQLSWIMGRAIVQCDSGVQLEGTVDAFTSPAMRSLIVICMPVFGPQSATTDILECRSRPTIPGIRRTAPDASHCCRRLMAIKMVCLGSLLLILLLLTFGEGQTSGVTSSCTAVVSSA